MCNNNINNVNTISALSTQQIAIQQTAGSDFILFNNGDTRMNAKRDAYVQGDRDTYLLATQNMNVRAPNTQYITIQQTGLANDSFIQFQPSGVLDIFSRYVMSIRTLSTNSIKIEQQGAAYNSFLELEAGGTSVLQSRGNLNIRTLSTNQVTIYQESGSDFVLFNSGDTRMNAVRDAYVGGNRYVYIDALQDSYLKATSNVVLETTNGYINLVAQGGSNGIYLTGSFTEVRGYLTFNAVNNYINNLEHIYGDTTAPGGGLAIDYMYGLFFNSSGKNANLYIDAGNLNMINYNSGINIANYNANGTGNVSLYSASNDIYVATGTGRDINLNGGRYVSINAAQPDGACLIYASTINATSLLDTNLTIGLNFNVNATGSAQLHASYFNFFSDCYFNNCNLRNLSNIYFTKGVLSIDASNQLSYATQGTGLSVGVSGAIPLIQYGKVTLSNSSTSNTVSLPISYEANTSYVAHITLNSNVPESGLDFSIEISDSNYFTVYQTASVGSNDHTYFWTTTGEYPPGPPT